MKNSLSILLFICISSTLAAPAMKGPTCEITANVEQIQKRKEFYKDESWRKSWGLPKYIEYTDLTLSVISSKETEKGFGSCEEIAKKKIFQLRDKEIELKAKDCIRAQTQFSGDEFSIGQWLFKISKIENIKCSKK